MALTAAGMAASVEDPAASAAGRTLKPPASPAKAHRGVEKRHNLIDVMPIIVAPAVPIHQAQAMTEVLEADRSGCTRAERPGQG